MVRGVGHMAICQIYIHRNWVGFVNTVKTSSESRKILTRKMFAMASTFAVLLLMSSGLFKTTTGDYCYSYLTKDNKLKDTINCLGLYCCGSCEFRYCCPLPSLQFTESEQFFCNFNSDIVIALIVGVVITIIGIIVCCFVCRMCRRTRPVAGAHVTTVMNTTQLVQQQPAIQNPAYQPVPTQPGYSVQPAQLGPHPPQLSAPVPYNTAMSPEYPTVQAYNPAYTQPAKTGF